MSELNIATVNQTLQGVWHLDRWEITYDNGRATTYPFGANATGLIHYTQDGGMSACIARADPPVCPATASEVPRPPSKLRRLKASFNMPAPMSRAYKMASRKWCITSHIPSTPILWAVNR